MSKKVKSLSLNENRGKHDSIALSNQNRDSCDEVDESTLSDSSSKLED